MARDYFFEVFFELLHPPVVAVLSEGDTEGCEGVEISVIPQRKAEHWIGFHFLAKIGDVVLFKNID
jgi:hypothetical protein